MPCPHFHERNLYFWYVPAAGVTCPFVAGYVASAGYTHNGDDILQWSGTKTVQFLAASCDNTCLNLACRAFTWSPYSNIASGYLKGSSTGSTAMAGMCLYKQTSESR